MTKSNPNNIEQWALAVCGSQDAISHFADVLEDAAQGERADLATSLMWIVDNVTVIESTYLVFSHPSDSIDDKDEWEQALTFVEETCTMADLDMAYAFIGDNIDTYDFRPGVNMIIPYSMNLCSPIRIGDAESTSMEDDDEPVIGAAV